MAPDQPSKPELDETLIRGIAKGHAWFEQLTTSACSITEIAKAERVTHRQITVHLELAFLSPKIVSAMLEGRQPIGLTLQTLKEAKIPRGWDEQERLFGFV